MININRLNGIKLSVTLKQVETKEENEQFYNMPIYGYYPSPDDGNARIIDRYKKLDKVYPNSKYLIYENDKPVSGAAFVTLEQHIRGKIFQMGGVLNVNSYPEVRRKGYVTKLMHRIFEDLYDLNYPVSCLYPFKESFYGKFGYINFPQYRTMTIKPHKIKHFDYIKNYGTVERGRLKDNWELYVQLLNKMKDKIHGFSVFNNIENMPIDEIQDLWIGIARDDNEQIIGLITYKTKGIYKEAIVKHFIYYNTIGKYLLLNYIAKHTDQFTEFKVPLKPSENSEYWAYDFADKIETRSWVPSAQGRIIDIEKLEGIDVGDGMVKIRVKDSHCSWNDQVWQLQSVQNKLIIDKVEKSEQSISINALSALIYGAYSPTDFSFRWQLNLNSEILDILFTMFPPKSPWLFSDF